MKKILVIPNSFGLLGQVLDTDITGVILPISGFSVNSDCYFSISDVKSILNYTSKEVCVSLNKIMHNSDLKELERALVALNKMNIQKIFFYDLAVYHLCKRLGIKKELVIFQDHLNASGASNLFYRKRGIAYSVITNDITLEEMNQIGEEVPLMFVSYGYLPIFYSRRYLITNYLKHLSLDKEEGNYYIRHGEDRYPIVEEDYGTTIYTKKPIDCIQDIKDMKVEYLILNSTLVNRDGFMDVVSKYLADEEVEDDANHYDGFLHQKTVYKLEDLS